jgi:hypothetical protein
MERLNEYINSVCKNLKDDDGEIDVMRQEMKNHLLQSVEDLKAQGKSEKESINIAIDRFGEADILKRQLKQIYNVQRNFSKRIFNIALILLFVGIFSLISQVLIHYNSNNVDTKLLYSVQNILKNGGMSNDKLKNLFQHNDNKFKFYNKDLAYIAVFKYPNNYNGNIEEVSFKDAAYIFPNINSLNNDLKRKGYISNVSSGKKYFTNDNKWFISIGYITPRIQWLQYGFNNIINIFGIVFMVSSLILFTISTFINIYHKKKVDFI